MKELVLKDIHAAFGARMALFAGYNMPIYYPQGITEEHHQVRKKVGVFDVSHMGEFIVKGTQALELIQSLTTNDASKLSVGQAQYSCLPNDSGGIIDDLLVYRLAEDQCAAGERAYMLVVNADNIEKDWNWIVNHNAFDTKLVNISDRTSLLAVQGPDALTVLQTLTDIPLKELAYYTFTKGRLAEIDNILISATGYTGSGGFELYVDNDQVLPLWEKIFAAGKPYDIKPIGLGARDTLRLEMGYCLYGHDIDDTTSPLEAGLGWITKLQKGHFMSSEIIKNKKLSGLNKKLVGFKVLDRRVPRQHYLIHSLQNEIIGQVTSGTMSPSLGIPLGMGYVRIDQSNIGNKIKIEMGSRSVEAVISKIPFEVD